MSNLARSKDDRRSARVLRNPGKGQRCHRAVELYKNQSVCIAGCFVRMRHTPLRQCSEFPDFLELGFTVFLSETVQSALEEVLVVCEAGALRNAIVVLNKRKEINS
jgi:hypothetical protein